jgi:hypothetical protein
MPLTYPSFELLAIIIVALPAVVPVTHPYS